MSRKRFVNLTVFFLICMMLVAVNVYAGEGEEVLKKEHVRITTVGEVNITEFHEAPMLAEKVKNGELPPVEERLPEDPMVVIPEEEIGKYGGTIHLTQFSSDNLGIPGHVLTEAPLMFNRDLENLEVIPNFVKDWEFTNGAKTLTMYLRKGIKFSDGDPLTVDDFLFYFNDILLNKEITPVTPQWIKPGGEVMEVTKIDDYTFKMDFALPYRGIINYLNSYWYWGVDMFPPSHYLKKYHIKYNPDAAKLAEEEGYDTWVQLFNHYYSGGFTLPKPVGRPRLSAWIVKEVTPTGRIYERNPYYWKVDTEGNQLPYIDKIKTIYVPDAETRKLKVLAGDIDYIAAFLSLTDFPTFKKNEDAGGYNAWIGKSVWANRVMLPIQQNYTDDPVLSEILANKKFRQALSLAINREEINDLVFMGQGEPRQVAYSPATITSIPKEKIDEWASSYAEYDPERAIKMLEEIGLVDSDGDGWRERPDGEVLLINLQVNSSRELAVKTAELVRDYWQNIGVKINMRAVQESTFFTNEWGGMTQIATDFETGDIPPRLGYTPAEPTHFTYTNWLLRYNPFTGEVGEIPENVEAVKPPREIIDWYTWGQKLPYATEEERKELLIKIGNYVAENLPAIGTVGMAGHVGISNKDLGNVRRVGDNPTVAALRNAYMEQFYWKSEENRQTK